DVADGGDLDLVDLRRVDGERTLDADAERLLSHRERLARACTLPLDDDALEDLRAAPRALDHLEVHAHGVAGLEGGEGAQLAGFELGDRVHRKVLSSTLARPR